LSQFHLDTDWVGNKAWEKYSRIYEKRRRNKSLHGSENREKAALVFAIASTLNEEKIPRPIGQIASVCGFPRRHMRRLLKIEKTLRLEEGERETFPSPDPVDYVNALCVYLDIPFSVGLQAERILENEELKWALYGHRPQHFAAAAIEGVLKARGFPSKQRELSRELGCGISSIKRLVQKIPRRLYST
jgi:transcription initiation factor TFIIIB Brf1 subunit/transcription initiation factor TFIIB